ncbi:MAG: hypothetical protein ACREFN_13505, partial [Acetobacteraceae bacterium]
CTKPCWAASHLVTTTSKRRLFATRSCITEEQLASVRRQIALSIGIESWSPGGRRWARWITV